RHGDLEDGTAPNGPRCCGPGVAGLDRARARAGAVGAASTETTENGERLPESTALLAGGSGRDYSVDNLAKEAERSVWSRGKHRATPRAPSACRRQPSLRSPCLRSSGCTGTLGADLRRTGRALRLRGALPRRRSGELGEEARAHPVCVGDERRLRLQEVSDRRLDGRQHGRGQRTEDDRVEPGGLVPEEERLAAQDRE